MVERHFTTTVVSPDSLRRIRVELIQHGDSGPWSITLELLERLNTAAQFESVGKMTVPVAPDDYEGAKAIAENGLCEEQTAQAWVAADATKGNGDDAQLAILQILRVG